MIYPNLEAEGLMTKDEVDALWDFQRRSGARAVKWNAFQTGVGYTYAGGCSSGPGEMEVSAGAAALGVSGVRPGARLDFNGIWRCPSQPNVDAICPMWGPGFENGVYPACTVTPAVRVPGGGAVAALVNYADGRESLAFMHGCAAWSSACMLLGHFSVAWAFQHVIPGSRAALLTVQADDFFLPSEQAGSAPFRLRPWELRRHLAWQADLVAGGVPGISLAPGSDIRVDLPFNGNGILLNISSAAAPAMEVDGMPCFAEDAYYELGCSCFNGGWASCPATAPAFCRQCTKDWPKPAGSGTNRITTVADPAAWTPELLRGDGLAALAMDDVGGAANGFFWSHHTFTHQYLDNATAFDATQQIGLNKAMAEALGLSGRASYSGKCLVTPQISGLANGDVLSSFAAAAVTCATGDNTWRHLMHPTNPHAMLSTTAAANGYDGFSILPRWATEIYFNCSTVQQNLDLYNHIYAPQLGPSTFDQVLDREAARVLGNILALRKDPHMMHQANLRVEGGSTTDFTVGSSLLMRWVERVLSRLTGWVTWPVRSLKLDDLMAAYSARAARDACALSYRLEVATTGPNAGRVVAVSVASGGGGCGAPFIAGGAAAAAGAARDGLEAAAPLFTVPLAAGGAARVETAGIPWNLPLP
ncbi:MAG: hypothetical protein J3K34DRAFT_461466 [Monoraphidium minutum]|nr:MAG: hypothetical protein J3K34DRAFT_461466 [Monoraphidium minutum]